LGAVPPLALGTLFANGINAAGLNLNNGNRNRAGFLGGGQIGINWQFTPAFVVGAELDFQGVWTNRNDNGNFGIAAVGEAGFPPSRPRRLSASTTGLTISGPHACGPASSPHRHS
jgi:outer membrane immunogenic protein